MNIKHQTKRIERERGMISKHSREAGKGRSHKTRFPVNANGSLIPAEHVQESRGKTQKERTRQREREGERAHSSSQLAIHAREPVSQIPAPAPVASLCLIRGHTGIMSAPCAAGIAHRACADCLGRSHSCSFSLNSL